MICEPGSYRMDYEKLDHISYSLWTGALDDGASAGPEYLDEVYKRSCPILLIKQTGSIRMGCCQARGNGKGPVPYGG
jgi:hypothetical protein